MFPHQFIRVAIRRVSRKIKQLEPRSKRCNKRFGLFRDMSRAAINNQEDFPLCPDQKPFQKLDEYIGINAAFCLDHKPHMTLRCNRREKAHAMTSAGCYAKGRFACLATAAPGMVS